MIELSERDRNVIDYLLIHRAERKSRIRELFYSDVGQRAFYSSIGRLVENLSELICEDRVSFLRERVLIAKPIAGVVGTYTEHDLRVSDILSAFANLMKHTPLKIYREYQIRTQGIVSEDLKNSYYYGKIPDAAIQVKDKLLAIELENTQKSFKRIYESVQKFESTRFTNVDYTLVFCVSDAIYKAYCRATADYLTRSRKSLESSRVLVLNCKYMSFRNDYQEKLKTDIQNVLKKIGGETK